MHNRRPIQNHTIIKQQKRTCSSPTKIHTATAQSWWPQFKKLPKLPSLKFSKNAPHPLISSPQTASQKESLCSMPPAQPIGFILDAEGEWISKSRGLHGEILVSTSPSFILEYSADLNCSSRAQQEKCSLRSYVYTAHSLQQCVEHIRCMPLSMDINSNLDSTAWLGWVKTCPEVRVCPLYGYLYTQAVIPPATMLLLAILHPAVSSPQETRSSTDSSRERRWRKAWAALCCWRLSLPQWKALFS